MRTTPLKVKSNFKSRILSRWSARRVVLHFRSWCCSNRPGTTFTPEWSRNLTAVHCDFSRFRSDGNRGNGYCETARAIFAADTDVTRMYRDIHAYTYIYTYIFTAVHVRCVHTVGHVNAPLIKGQLRRARSNFIYPTHTMHRRHRPSQLFMFLAELYIYMYAYIYIYIFPSFPRV